MTKERNGSIKEEVVDGIFGLLHKWWFWLIVSVFAGVNLGIIGKDNILHLLDRAVEIVTAMAGKL